MSFFDVQGLLNMWVRGWEGGASLYACRGDEPHLSRRLGVCGAVTTGHLWLSEVLQLEARKVLQLEAKSPWMGSKLMILQSYNLTISQIKYKPRNQMICLIYNPYGRSFPDYMKLLTDGDIESNPGPIASDLKTHIKLFGGGDNSCNSEPQSSNVEDTPKGRKKKGKKFNFMMCKKLDMGNDIEQSIDQVDNSHIDFSISVPIGLRNMYVDNFGRTKCANVCFFNCVIQLLKSIPTYHSYILQSNIDHPVVENLKALFQQINKAADYVDTFDCVQKLGIPGYEKGSQFDALECISHILENSYPNEFRDQSIFKIGCNVTMECECGRHYDRDDPDLIFKLDTEDWETYRSVKLLLDRCSRIDGVVNKDYRCEGNLIDQPPDTGCGKKGKCYEYKTIAFSGDVLILHLQIVRFDNNFQPKKINPRIEINDELMLSEFGQKNRFELCGIIWHEGETINTGHYTSNVKINGTWYYTNDTTVSRGRKIYEPSTMVVPYILMYKKNNNMLIPFSSPIPTVINPESMNRYSLVKELAIQKDRIATVEKRKSIDELDGGISKKSKACNSEVGKEGKNLEKKVELKFNFQKRKRKSTEQNRKCAKKVMSDIRSTPEGKEQNRKCAKKGMSDIRSTPEGKEQNQKCSERIRSISAEVKEKAFEAVRGKSMTDPSIIRTDAFKIIQSSWQKVMNEGPEYTCAICIKQEWKSNVVKLNKGKYEKHSKMFDICYQDKHYWLKEIIDPEIFVNRFKDKEEYICKGCDKHLINGKMPPQAQANNLQLNRIEDELRDLCPLELMLISRVIPFMFIVPKHKGAQFGLKGQCILVPSDLKKTVSSLPRACDDNCVISLALKRRLSDRSYHSQQNIRPAKVNKALKKLKEINPFYSFVSIDENSWVNVSQESDPELWDLLTNDKAKPDDVDLTDSDEEIEGNDVVFEKENQDSTVPHPTVLHNINGTNIEAGEVLNLAPAEGQIPVSFTSEPDWEALAFVKEFPLGKGHFNENRNVAITPSQYVHTRLKCADDRFANNAQYVFAQLDLIERAAIWSSITFAENKRFQDNITVGEVKNNIHRMLSDQQIYYTFKNIRGTPQYNRNQLLDILAKVRQFGCYTFFLTITAGIPHFWFEIFQILGHQYGKNFSKEDVMNMSNKERINWLKRNPVTVARQVDYLFTKFLGPTVIMSGMHPIGQILNYDEKREFQMRGVEHPHCALHVKDAPKLDENSDNEVVDFIDKFITCSLPDENTEPELHELVTSRLSHKHTFTCRKKKGVRCRFNAPWPPSKTTRIIRGENLSREEVKKSKRVVDKVLHEITSMQYGLNDVILEDILDFCRISEEEYENAMDTMQRNTTILYKRQANEINVVPYNTVLLTLLRSNMNIQFVTGSYGLLTYLTAYMCKDDKNMSELMKKASKEAASGDIRGKLKKVGNVFVKNREVGIHEATKRVLSGPFRRSNLQTIYIPTGPQNERIRMLKPKYILDLMSSDDVNVFATNMVEKYSSRPDILEDICYADFATTYKSKNVDDTPDEDHIKNYTNPVDIDVEELQLDMEIITLKNGLGKMQKRKKMCDALS